MSKASVFDPFTPPAVQAWLKSQSEAGCSRRDIFGALCEAGWKPRQVFVMMELTDDEKLVFGVAEVTPADSSNQTLVPRPQLILENSRVDGGDRQVRVLQLRTAPDLIEFEGLLSEAECEALIQAAQARLSRSLTVDVQTGGHEIHPDRSSQGMFFERAENPLIAAIEARIANLLQWPAKYGENLQVLRYPPGAQYLPHYDYFDPDQPGTAELLKRGGQRVATLIMYLHEPDSGGATVFPDIDLSIAPKRGNAIFFSYAAPEASTLTLHGGEPVTAGEKWIATKWLRQSIFE